MSDWITEGLFRKKSVSLFVGDSNVGKTLLLLDLAYSVATGSKWLSQYECLQGPVVFLAGESSLDMLDSRVIGINKGRGRTPKWYLENGSDLLSVIAQRDSESAETFPLSSHAWRARVEYMLENSLPGAKPILWVFDPIIALAKDPDAEESKDIMKWCFRLADLTNGHVVLAHHLRKGKGQGGQESHSDRIRGDSAWRGLADSVLYCVKGKTNNRMAHVYLNKARDGDSPGEDHPLFHVLRDFSKIPTIEFYEMLQDFGVKEVKDAAPESIWNIDLRFIPYTADLEETEEKYKDTVRENLKSTFQETIEAEIQKVETLLKEENVGGSLAAYASEEEPEGEPEEEPAVLKDGRLDLSIEEGTRPPVKEDGYDEVGKLVVEILGVADKPLSMYEIWVAMKNKAKGVGQARLQKRLELLVMNEFIEPVKQKRGAHKFQLAQTSERTA